MAATAQQEEAAVKEKQPEEKGKEGKEMDFSYTPITTAKKCIVQRSSGYTKGEVVGLVSMSYGIAPQESVDTKDLEEIMKKVGKLEDERAKHRETLQDCNSKLGDMIDKSRTLEDDNKNLTDELRELRNNWGHDTRKVREDNEDELNRLRKELEDSENENAELAVKIEALENELANIRDKIDDEMRKGQAAKEFATQQKKKLADIENEIDMMNRRKKQLETERNKLVEDNKKLKEEIKKLLDELERATIDHIKAENAAHTLKEELDFLKLVWELEKKELELLTKRDLSSENREYWKSEIANLIRELQDEFDKQIDDYKGEVKNYYDSKVLQLQAAAPKEGGDSEELNNMRKNVDDLRDKNDKLKKELDELEPLVNELEKEVQRLLRELENEKLNYDQEFANISGSLAAAKKEIERLMGELRKLFDQKIALEIEVTQYQKMLDMEISRRKKEDEDGEDDPDLKQKKASKVQAGRARPKKPQDEGDKGKPEAKPEGKEGQPEGKPEGKPEDKENKPEGKDAKDAKAKKSELSAKTVPEKKLLAGPVEISEVSPDSRCITLSNLGDQNVGIDGWKLVRKLDEGARINEFTFPNTGIAAKQQLKIYAKGARPKNAPPSDLDFEKASWGLGATTSTSLYHKNGQELAWFKTKTVYQND